MLNVARCHFKLIVAVLCVGLTACQPAEKQADLDIRIGMTYLPGSILMVIAKENGYFEQAGLHPTYATYPSGKRALDDGLFQGVVDVTAASDAPVANAVYHGKALAVIATMQFHGSANAIVARKDRHIATIADLKGHLVGAQKLSAVHYFLDQALRFNDLEESDIQTVFMPAEKLVDALVQGRIDAFSMREPYISNAVARMPNNTVVLTAPWIYPQMELVVSTPQFVDQSAPTLRRLLIALMRAEDFVLGDPAAAATLISKAMDISQKSADNLLRHSISSVRLPQVLVPLLEQEIEWVGRVTKDARHTPPLQATLRPQILQSLRPGSVSVVLENSLPVDVK